MVKSFLAIGGGLLISKPGRKMLHSFVGGSDPVSFETVTEVSQDQPEMVYRNVNVQTRANLSQKFFWFVRPFGNPNPGPASENEGFISEQASLSEDGLTYVVETIWNSREDFLKALPPEHFEQPMFDNWHKENGVRFSFKEEYIKNPRKMA